MRDEATEPTYAVRQTALSACVSARHNAQRTGTECYANLKAV